MSKRLKCNTKYKIFKQYLQIWLDIKVIHVNHLSFKIFLGKSIQEQPFNPPCKRLIMEVREKCKQKKMKGKIFGLLSETSYGIALADSNLILQDMREYNCATSPCPSQLYTENTLIIEH